MPWSLVEVLSVVGQPRRAFYLPLASIPPGNAAVRAVTQNQFDLSDDRTQPNDPVFRIRILPPAGGFADEGTLPDPALRVHAMTAGIVRFAPSDAVMADRLILEMPMFLGAINAPWWGRWVEAGCLPHKLIYENVDRVQLETRLTAMTAGQSSFGLSFPPEVTTVASQNEFITGFMAGQQTNVMSAEAGAFLATVVENAAHDRILRIHVRYNGHTDAVPFPMNPREFIHLLFGNDSAEIATHPLLLKMDAFGLGQLGIESKTMRLRPPLRTSGRLLWEANLEIDNHQASWTPAAALGAARFYNDHTRAGRAFNNGGYAGSNKCNLFTSDIALRAGFRASVHDVGPAAWHYIDANSHANLIHNAAGATDRVGVMGRAEDAAVTWAWKIENWIRTLAIADVQASVNAAINNEGRCLILAGARARKFVNRNCGGTQGVCNCSQSLRSNGIGHIVLVRELLAQPTPAATVGEGFQSIRVQTLEASGTGAVSRDATFQVGGAAAAAAGMTGFIRLHLFELHPGQDPDTPRGLRNLNIHNSNRNLLNTANERAAQQSLNLNADGTPRTDHMCCQDQWPATNTATVVVC